MVGRYKVITLCGSTRFKEDFLIIRILSLTFCIFSKAHIYQIYIIAIIQLS